MTETLPLFVTCPRGLEPLLVAELTDLGALEAKERRGGVACRGPLDVAYRACLWSRLASRVLMPLTSFELVDAESLYAGARAVDWPELFAPDSSFSIEVAGRSAAVTHTHYAGLKVKDAVADTFRERHGRRPDVNTSEPDIRIHVHLDRAQATLSLDLSGESLHRRGYRGGTGEAPLKENLACAILLRAGWPQIAAEGGPLLDPMCGSGTFLIEGAWMAADIAPGLMRDRFGFEHWLDHVPATWHALKREAQSRRDQGLKRMPALRGRDLDPRVLTFARKNALNAGLKDLIAWEAGDLLASRPIEGEPPGLLVTNPPYGERMAAEGEVIKLYSLLGATLKSHFPGWRAAVFTSRPDLGPRIGLRADAMHAFYNGDLPCKLLQFQVAAPEPRIEAVEDAPLPTRTGAPSEFANRLAKNRKHLGKWARRTGVTCYRVYDADLPDYALAVDVYEALDGELHLHVQEYAAPKTIDPVKAEKRLREALADLQAAYDLPASRLHFKQRAVQRGASQYEKQGDKLRVLEVDELGCKLLVNLDDYLDTGLFLDHRPMRLRLRREAAGKRVLNLFCYTGAASVQAALGGASQTVSVDLSNTYLHWAGRNLRLNGFEVGELAPPAPTSRESASGSAWRGKRRHEPPPAPHLTARADCMAWLRDAAEDPSRRFDLVFCDPPTFSNSKKLEGVFDIERDHPELIRLAAAVLAPGGTLYFSTNKRKFKLDPAAVEGLECEDITAQSLDEDFRRPPPPHRAWRIRRAASG